MTTRVSSEGNQRVALHALLPHAEMVESGWHRLRRPGRAAAGHRGQRLDPAPGAMRSPPPSSATGRSLDASLGELAAGRKPDYQVFVHLLDARRGNKFAQRDGQPPHGG